MDTVPLWFQMTTAIVTDLAGFAAIVGYLWPVFVEKETLPKLLRRRFLGRKAPPAPQTKSLLRAIFNILALVVSLLIIVGSSAFLGSIILRPTPPPPIATLTPTPAPTSTPTLAPTPTPTLTPTPGPPSVLITAPTDGSQVSILTTVQGTAQNIPKDEELWLFIVPSNQASYFPQPGPIKILGGQWSIGAHFGGASDAGLKFTLIPVLINQNDQEAHNALKKYFQQLGPVYQGIQQTSGMQLLFPEITVVRV